MWERPTNPLEIAASILRPETIRSVREGGFTNSGYMILDRWALNSPDELKQLEAQGELAVLVRLDQQQTIEKRTLCSDSAWQASRLGVSDFEILDEAGIDMDLRISTS